MKINLKLPELGDKFSHDAPLYGVIKFALPAFILISSLTVFAGVRVHASNFFKDVAWYISTPGYSLAYIIFSLAPDMLNAVLIAYVVRSILKKHLKGTGSILNVAAVILIVFLTSYSYNMSKFSGGAIGHEIGQKKEEIDLSNINESYNKKVTDIEERSSKEIEGIGLLYANRIAAAKKKQATEINPLREKIKMHKRNTTEDNKQWRNKKIRQLKDKIAGIEQATALVIENLLKEKQGKIDRKTELRDTRIAKLDTDKENDRNTTASLKEKSNANIEQANSFMSRQLAHISGYAVFIVLILASLKEIIHHRNKIEPQPILTNLDFQSDWIKEVIMYPFVKHQRKMINRVRTKYGALPELIEPPATTTIIEYNAKQEIIKLEPGYEEAELDDENQNGYFFRTQNNTKKDTESRVPFTAHENNTKTATNNTKSQTRKTRTDNTKPVVCVKDKKHENTELSDALTRLKLYKKRLAIHEQKAIHQKKKTGVVSNRTLNAIDNNQGHVQRYEALVKELQEV